MTEPQIEFVRRNDSLKPTRVGVFSSSFNPPTKAHIAMCAKACQVFELQEIVLILTKVNADKELVGATLEQRKEMMLAVTREEMFPDWNEHNNSDMPHISVALCTHPRFIDVLTALKTWFFPPTQLHFIMVNLKSIIQLPNRLPFAKTLLELWSIVSNVFSSLVLRVKTRWFGCLARRTTTI
eukprot:c9749_g1_i2.p1 GENE.c9749_g1_i2~~c9749_g1_i2.p1  ORF type:complete len:182 (+),score=18.53 c9749_g1_i2:164-709(+)